MKRMKKRYLWFIGLALILILVLLIIFATRPETQMECLTDSDCVKVQTTCCACESGGIEQCVSLILAPSYNKKISNCAATEDQICIEQYNCQIESCICQEGKCLTIEKNETAEISK